MADRDRVIDLDRLSAAGVLEASYPFPAVSRGPGFDVAPDGCTVFYASIAGDRIGGRIHRFDGCTGTALPDFATTPRMVNDLEVQPDGRVLVATDANVFLYRADGTLERTVVASVAAYGFDALRTVIDQVSLRQGVLWLTPNDPCGEGTLLRVSFADGTELSRRRPSVVHVTYHLVVGSASLAAVPTAGEGGLSLLALALAAGGVLLLRVR